MNYLSDNFFTLEEGYSILAEALGAYSQMMGSIYEDAMWDDIVAIKIKISLLEKEKDNK